MGQIILKNVDVVIEDPQDKYVSGEEFHGVFQECVGANQVVFSIPEEKPKEVKVDKPKPVELLKTTMFKIRATLRADGKPQLSWMGKDHDLDMGIGKRTFLSELKTAGERVWKCYEGD